MQKVPPLLLFATDLEDHPMTRGDEHLVGWLRPELLTRLPSEWVAWTDPGWFHHKKCRCVSGKMECVCVCVCVAA